MKRLIIIILSFSFSNFIYSQGYLRPNYSYGLEYYRIKTDSVLHVPQINDTKPHTTDQSSQLRVINGKLKYYYNGYWSMAGGGNAGDLLHLRNDSLCLGGYSYNNDIDLNFDVNDQGYQFQITTPQLGSFLSLNRDWAILGTLYEGNELFFELQGRNNNCNQIVSTISRDYGTKTLNIYQDSLGITYNPIGYNLVNANINNPYWVPYRFYTDSFARKVAKDTAYILRQLIASYIPYSDTSIRIATWEYVSEHSGGSFPYTKTLTSDVVWNSDGNHDFNLGFTTAPLHTFLNSQYETGLNSLHGIINISNPTGTLSFQTNYLAYTETGGNGGIQYGGNYAARYTDYSLVTKHDLDSTVAAHSGGGSIDSTKMKSTYQAHLDTAKLHLEIAAVTSGEIHSVSILLNSTKLIHNFWIKAIDAPADTNYMIIPISIVAKFHYVAPAYTSGEFFIAATYDTTTTPSFMTPSSITNLLTYTANTITPDLRFYDNTMGVGSLFNKGALFINNSTAATAGGNGTLRVQLFYYLVNKWN